MPVWIDGGPRRSRRSRTVRAALLAAVPVLAIGGALAGSGALPEATLVDAPGDIAPGASGGHGRGMSQLGALTYAKQGWDAQRILAFYYPGTTLGTVHTGLPVTVRLSERNRVDVLAPAGALVGGKQIMPGQAVSIDGTTATIRQGCGGQVLGTVESADRTVSPITADQGIAADQVLRFCGDNARYRGRLVARDDAVLNVVGIEDYVRSVVPVENSPGWADQGGVAALQAQAIAARSYVLVRGAERGETFDDTQASQVYGGVDKEDSRTDAVIVSTYGLVMAKDGRVVETEYGASRADDPASS